MGKNLLIREKTDIGFFIARDDYFIAFQINDEISDLLRELYLEHGYDFGISGLCPYLANAKWHFEKNDRNFIDDAIKYADCESRILSLVQKNNKNIFDIEMKYIPQSMRKQYSGWKFRTLDLLFNISMDINKNIRFAQVNNSIVDAGLDSDFEFYAGQDFIDYSDYQEHNYKDRDYLYYKRYKKQSFFSKLTGKDEGFVVDSVIRYSDIYRISSEDGININIHTKNKIDVISLIR